MEQSREDILKSQYVSYSWICHAKQSISFTGLHKQEDVDLEKILVFLELEMKTAEGKVEKFYFSSFDSDAIVKLRDMLDVAIKSQAKYRLLDLCDIRLDDKSSTKRKM